MAQNESPEPIDPAEEDRRALACRNHELLQTEAAIRELEAMDGNLHPVSVLRTERDRLKREIRTIEKHMERTPA